MLAWVECNRQTGSPRVLKERLLFFLKKKVILTIKKQYYLRPPYALSAWQFYCMKQTIVRFFIVYRCDCKTTTDPVIQMCVMYVNTKTLNVFFYLAGCSYSHWDVTDRQDSPLTACCWGKEKTEPSTPWRLQWKTGHREAQERLRRKTEIKEGGGGMGKEGKEDNRKRESQ